MKGIGFDELVDCLVREQDYRKSLEKKIERLEHERDGWRDSADPGWRDRERRAALDAEIGLMRQ